MAHWLGSAERVRIPFRRVSGAHATVFLGRLPGGSHQYGVYASAPGLTGFGMDQGLGSDALINRHNALVAALLAVRSSWSDVPALVADVNEAIDTLWE